MLKSSLEQSLRWRSSFPDGLRRPDPAFVKIGGAVGLSLLAAVVFAALDRPPDPAEKPAGKSVRVPAPPAVVMPEIAARPPAPVLAPVAPPVEALGDPGLFARPSEQQQTGWTSAPAPEAERPQPAPAATADASVSAPAVPERRSEARTAALASNADAPLECLPQALRDVLADMTAKFEGLTVVSTNQLHTDNHSPGSAREKMHTDCKAVDVKAAGDPKDVIAYLRSRPEVGGVNSYRNKVVHFDLNPNYNSASARGR
jgi:hypothetical protein